jgi:hypothetical protein
VLYLLLRYSLHITYVCTKYSWIIFLIGTELLSFFCTYFSLSVSLIKYLMMLKGSGLKTSFGRPEIISGLLIPCPKTPKCINYRSF